MDLKRFGDFLKQLRKENNFTQEQLADKLSVSSRTVSRWETGYNMPDISILVELSELYQISLSELIKGERKSENMNEETKEVVQSLSEYIETKEDKMICKNFKKSIVCMFSMYVFWAVYLISRFCNVGAEVLSDLVVVFLFTWTIATISILTPAYALLDGYLLRNRNNKHREKIRKMHWVLSIFSIAFMIVGTVIISVYPYLGI